MTGINLTRQCCLTEKHIADFRKISTRGWNSVTDLAEHFLRSCEDETQLTGATIHDACAAAWVIDPDLIKPAPMHIDIELKGELTRG